MREVILELLEESDAEQFILDNQQAFRYGALVEFGQRDNHFEEDGEIISRATIEKSIKEGIAYRIVADGRKVGGAVVHTFGSTGELDLLFVIPSEHTKGIGAMAWNLIEKKYPQVKHWETMTPYFEKRNIHFYINKCGFKIVEFFCEFHTGIKENENDEMLENQNDKNLDGMFRFVKEID